MRSQHIQGRSRLKACLGAGALSGLLFCSGMASAQQAGPAPSPPPAQASAAAQGGGGMQQAQPPSQGNVSGGVAIPQPGSGNPIVVEPTIIDAPYGATAAPSAQGSGNAGAPSAGQGSDGNPLDTGTLENRRAGSRAATGGAAGNATTPSNSRQALSGAERRERRERRERFDDERRPFQEEGFFEPWNALDGQGSSRFDRFERNNGPERNDGFAESNDAGLADRDRQDLGAASLFEENRDTREGQPAGQNRLRLTAEEIQALQRQGLTREQIAERLDRLELATGADETRTTRGRRFDTARRLLEMDGEQRNSAAGRFEDDRNTREGQPVGQNRLRLSEEEIGALQRRGLTRAQIAERLDRLALQTGADETRTTRDGRFDTARRLLEMEDEPLGQTGTRADAGNLGLTGSGFSGGGGAQGAAASEGNASRQGSVTRQPQRGAMDESRRRSDASGFQIGTNLEDLTGREVLPEEDRPVQEDRRVLDRNETRGWQAEMRVGPGGYTKWYYRFLDTDRQADAQAADGATSAERSATQRPADRSSSR